MRLDLLLSFAAVATLPPLLTGCRDLLGDQDGNRYDDGAGGEAATSATGSGGAEVGRRGVAVREEDLSVLVRKSLCEDQGVCDLDPRTLFLHIDEGGGQCTHPFVPRDDPDAERFWFAIHPDAQAVGIYALGTTVQLGNQHGLIQPAEGSLVEVTAIDEERVQIRTRGVFSPDVLHEFARCDTTAKVDGLAVPQQAEPAGALVSITPGAATCSDLERSCATERFWLQVRLPDRQPGRHALASVATMWCDLDDEDIVGELEVVQADEAQLVLRIHDMPTLPPDLDRALILPLCP